MSDLRVEQVRTSELQTAAELNGGNIVLTLEGTADLEAVDPLKKLLPQVHSEALRLGVSEVQLDMRKLDFMNSSCFKAFVTWLHEVKLLDDNERYKLAFLSTPEQHWQERSLHALRNFATDLVRIESGQS